MSTDKAVSSPLPEAVREQIEREYRRMVTDPLTVHGMVDAGSAKHAMIRVAEAAAQQARAIDPKAAFISGYYAGQYLAGTLSDEDAWKQWVDSCPPPTPEDR